MAEPRQRKLTAMAIASLVSTGHPEVLKRLSGEIFNLWTDVLCELQEVFNQAALDGTRLVSSLFGYRDCLLNDPFILQLSNTQVLGPG